MSLYGSPCWTRTNDLRINSPSLSRLSYGGISKPLTFIRGLVLALPFFPGRRQPSIVGRNELNYRVRNGNGWTLILINTNSSSGFPENMHIIRSFGALVKRKNGDPYRIRTDVNGVRGRCLNHLTNGPCLFSTSSLFSSPVENLVHLHGLEPGTH